jgi:hypothetical protein
VKGVEDSVLDEAPDYRKMTKPKGYAEGLTANLALNVCSACVAVKR